MTVTDTAWTNRLQAIMPDNFMANISADFQGTMSPILTSMMNMIGRTIVHSPDTMMNPFAGWTKAIMDYGDTIQEYKSTILTGQEYDPEAEDVFATVKNSPIAQYSKYNDRTQYQQTIYDNQIKMAFTSESLFGDFVASQLDALTQSDTIDKFTKWKKYLSNGTIAPTTGKFVMTNTEGSEFGEELVKKMKELTTAFRFPSTNFNVNGDTAVSGGIDIIMRAEDKNLIDVDFLKGVYNLDKVGVDANFIYIDDFATVTQGKPEGAGDLVAVVADNRAFSYTPRTPVGSSAYNGKALNTNYWLTVQGIYSVAKFRNIAQIYLPTA